MDVTHPFKSWSMAIKSSVVSLVLSKRASSTVRDNALRPIVDCPSGWPLVVVSARGAVWCERANLRSGCRTEGCHVGRPPAPIRPSAPAMLSSSHLPVPAARTRVPQLSGGSSLPTSSSMLNQRGLQMQCSDCASPTYSKAWQRHATYDPVSYLHLLRIQTPVGQLAVQTLLCAVLKPKVPWCIPPSYSGSQAMYRRCPCPRFMRPSWHSSHATHTPLRMAHRSL